MRPESWQEHLVFSEIVKLYQRIKLFTVKMILAVGRPLIFYFIIIGLHLYLYFLSLALESRRMLR